jgi:ABC-2 type transport system permease protein
MRLQTEQWVVGSDILISVWPFLILLGYCLFYFALSVLLMKKLVKEQSNA